MIRSVVLATLVATSLGGCSVTLNTRAICQADRVQAWVGQVYSPRVEKRIKQRSLAYRSRVVRPGEMTTMEFNQRRVTIAIDEAGRVSRITCG